MPYNHKKEPCRNFLRGSCQFGERCKFLHVASQQVNHNTPFGFGVRNQQKPLSSLEFGNQQKHQSNPNAVGFGVHNKQQQFKPFDNKWSRFSPISNGGSTPSFKQSDSQPQIANHVCTDPNACKRLISEDMEHERPLWKLTCYGHWKNSHCDITGDISYDELRAMAYEGARQGLSLQSIVEKEKNLLNYKLMEFDNLLRNPYTPPLKSAVNSQSFFPGAVTSAPSPAQNNVPPAVSSFSQLGASLNLLSATRPSVPSTNPFGQGSVLSGSSQTVSSTSNPSAPVANHGSIGTLLITADNINSVADVAGQATHPAPLVSKNVSQQIISDGDSSIWLKETWIRGEIPEEAPADAYIY